MSHDDRMLPDLGRSWEASRSTLPQVESLGAHPTAPDPGALAGVIDWRRIATAVMRFKWVVILVTVVGTAAGIALSQFVDPTYVARATLWVDVRDVRAREQGPIQSGQLLGSSGWVDLLESHMVLDDVVRDLRLYLSWEAPADTSARAHDRIHRRVPARSGGAARRPGPGTDRPG
jgi:uncharacterized protein involved in exopolysaccharide biosynthesis